MGTKKVAEEAAEKGGKKAAEKPKGPKMLGSKEVASILKIKPAALRRFLRAQGMGAKDSGGEITRYEWAEGSPEIAKLGKAYAAHQAEVEEKRKEAGERLQKGKKGKAKAAKKGKTRAEEDTEDVEEEEEEEEEIE